MKPRALAHGSDGKIIEAPEGRKNLNARVMSVEVLSPLRGFPTFLRRIPTAHAVGYTLPPLRG